MYSLEIRRKSLSSSGLRRIEIRCLSIDYLTFLEILPTSLSSSSTPSFIKAFRRNRSAVQGLFCHFSYHFSGRPLSFVELCRWREIPNRRGRWSLARRAQPARCPTGGSQSCNATRCENRIRIVKAFKKLFSGIFPPFLNILLILLVQTLLWISKGHKPHNLGTT